MYNVQYAGAFDGRQRDTHYYVADKRRRIYTGFPKLGVPFWGGSYNEDNSILGSPISGNYNTGHVRDVMGPIMGVCRVLGLPCPELIWNYSFKSPKP